MGRSVETHFAYALHRERSDELGDCYCDMCRLAKEQKLSAGVLEISSKELEIVNRELERVEDEISLVENEYGYKFRNGLLVRKHLMVVTLGHYARRSDFPASTEKAYNHIMPFIMDTVDETFTHNPNSKVSSQKKHFHTHAVLYGEAVEEARYTRARGTFIRRRGNTELEQL